MADIPEFMRAVLLTGHGGFEKLDYRDDVLTPEPGPDDVLVRVAASSVNNTDINTRLSWYADDIDEGVTAGAGAKGFDDPVSESSGWSGSTISFPRIQGADVCGRIVAVGAGVSESRIGERVLCDVWFRDPDGNFVELVGPQP